MELIDLDIAAKVLTELDADAVSKELVLNNLRLYNQLILDYTVEGITKNLYLTYQLNVQVSKQLLNLYGLKKRGSSDVVDGFEALVEQLKGGKP